VTSPLKGDPDWRRSEIVPETPPLPSLIAATSNDSLWSWPVWTAPVATIVAAAGGVIPPPNPFTSM
jgi:hypothetical protein